MLVFHGAAGKAPPTSNIAGGFKPWARMPHCRSPLREVRATNNMVRWLTQRRSK